MADDVDTTSVPPPPLPKRKNAVLRLFDAPLYRDWLFWFMAVWAAIDAVSILTFGKPGTLPAWLTALIGAIFFAVVLGILPAWMRLIIRRWRWRRQQQREQSSRTAQAVAGRLLPPVETSQDGDHRRRSPTSADGLSGESDYNGDCGSSAGPSKGLGVTAADPVLVGIDSVAPVTTAAASSLSLQVHWDRIDADGFERLLVRLLEQSGSYVRITRLMNVNAADAGRDIQAYRHVSDGLVSERYERVVIQAKHWPKRGLSASEIADLVHTKLPLWEGEPIRGLIVAATGSFTQNAVRWVDDHNRAAKRPDIVLWSCNELDALLRKWPAVRAEFGLVD